MRVIKGVFIDTNTTCAKVITIPKTWQSYCDTIGSNSIQLEVKTVGNKEFALASEDYDSTKPKQIRSAVSKDLEETLYGNLLIMGLNEDNELTSLTDDDISLIFDNIHSYETNNGLIQRLEFER